MVLILLLEVLPILNLNYPVVVVALLEDEENGGGGFYYYWSFFVKDFEPGGVLRASLTKES